MTGTRNIVVVVLVVASGGLAPAFGFQLNVPSDFSWTAETYAERGMPSLEHPWTAGDYQTMQNVFKDINRQNRYHIPRHKSFHSGPVFERMISDENLKPLADQSIGLKERVGLATGLFGAIQKLIPVYAKPTLLGMHFDEDHVELLAFRLKIIRELLRLSKAELDALPEDDPDRPATTTRNQRLQSALGRIVHGTIREMDANHHMRSTAKLTLSNYLDEFLPEVVANLPKKTVENLRDQIKKLSRTNPRYKYGKVLERLAEKLP